MLATPQLLITQVGLNAASHASPTGPFIDIVAFKIGDAYGYIPQITDTDLNGSLLYSGIPTSYSYVGDGTMDILCTIPADAGPFSFGEVGIYLAGNVLFAKAVFDVSQIKYSSLGTNVASTYTLNCLIKLQQGAAVISVVTNSDVPVWEVDLWSDVYPPNVSANPKVQIIIVRELTPLIQDSTLLVQASATQWSISSNYKFLQLANVDNATTTYVESVATEFSSFLLKTSNRQLVIRFSNGYMRSVNSIIVSGSNYRFILNPNPLLSPPVAGDTYEIFIVASGATTPYVENGTGVNQQSNVVKIGQSSESKLLLTVDSKDYSNNWPINVAGTSGTLGNNNDLTQPMNFNWSATSSQPDYIWGGSNVKNQTVFPTKDLSVAFASGATHAVNADNATNAGFATNSNHAVNADNATNAGFATNANHANLADNAGFATNSNHANLADVSSSSLGNCQSWQDMSNSRSMSVNYTNTTGRSITVLLYKSVYQTSAYFAIDGISSAFASAGGGTTAGASVTFVVPNGVSYAASDASTWFELR